MMISGKLERCTDSTRFACVAAKLQAKDWITHGLIHAAHDNVTPTDNVLRKRCASATRHNGLTRAYFLAPYRATLSGMVAMPLASRCFRLCNIIAPCLLPVPAQLLSFSVPLRQQAHPPCFILHIRDAGLLTPLGTSFLVRSHKA